MANANGSNQTILLLLAVIVLGGLGYYAFTGPDNRTTAQHVGDAIGELPNGLNRAAKELDNQTPAEKIGNKINDEIKK